MSGFGAKVTDAGQWKINEGGLLLERAIQRTYSWSRGSLQPGQIRIFAALIPLKLIVLSRDFLLKLAL